MLKEKNHSAAITKFFPPIARPEPFYITLTIDSRAKLKNIEV